MNTSTLGQEDAHGSRICKGDKFYVNNQLTVQHNYTINMKYRSLTNIGIKTTGDAV